MPFFRKADSTSRRHQTPTAGLSGRKRPIKTILGLTTGGLLMAAGAIAMVQPDKATAPAQRLVSDALIIELPDRAAQAQAAQPHEYFTETRIQSGDTIASILSRLNIQEEGFMAFISSDPITRKAAHRLVPGRIVAAALDDEGGMKWLRYFHTPGTENQGQYQTEFLQITKTDDRSFVAQEIVADTESQMHLAAGMIRSSLFGATDGAGVPDAITLQMAEILGGRVDFLRDIRRGDEFRVLYETRTFEGRPAGSGRVLAVQFINNGKLLEGMWFSPEGERGGYYDSEGRSIQAAFLRNPIQFTRISSNFGMRQHPIHRNWRAHNGVDFAAPTGTPIRASGDGVVEFIGNRGGFGKLVILRHANNIKTLYAHQSRFARGLKRGDRVSQGEVIGYVGMTGWATGPHLHYEFHINSKPVDPMRIDMPEATVLDTRQREQFLTQASPWRDQLERIAEIEQADSGVTLAAR
jgi:murein DD-endopeptidase MepM/ murein hydrolase activator NlpD